MITDIRIQAAGRWSSVLQNIGLPAHYLNGKHQPCPVCEGKDRFRWNKSREAPYCSGCGLKSPVDLAMSWLSMPFKESAAEIRKVIGISTVTNTPTDDSAKNLARIQQIHKGLKRITPDCPVSKYIAKRGLSVLPEQDCYYHPEMAYYHDDKSKTEHPAMVSYFRNLAGEISTAHITYLTADGKKADLPNIKKVMPVAKPLPGCAIRLFKPAPILAIAEGIETALAVHQDQGLPVWAAGNANNMAAIQLPEEAKEIWVYADMDKSFTGQKAAYTLANRLEVMEKRIVRVVTLFEQGEQKTDRGEGGDFLDWYLVEQNESRKYAI